MANRNTLAISKIDDFKNWLVNDGWILQETKGICEALRATKQGKKYPLIIYRRNETDSGTDLKHLTVLDRDLYVVKEYLRSRK